MKTTIYISALAAILIASACSTTQNIGRVVEDNIYYVPGKRSLYVNELERQAGQAVDLDVVMQNRNNNINPSIRNKELSEANSTNVNPNAYHIGMARYATQQQVDQAELQNPGSMQVIPIPEGDGYWMREFYGTEADLQECVRIMNRYPDGFALFGNGYEIALHLSFSPDWNVYTLNNRFWWFPTSSNFAIYSKFLFGTYPDYVWTVAWNNMRYDNLAFNWHIGSGIYTGWHNAYWGYDPYWSYGHHGWGYIPVYSSWYSHYCWGWEYDYWSHSHWGYYPYWRYPNGGSNHWAHHHGGAGWNNNRPGSSNIRQNYASRDQYTGNRPSPNGNRVQDNRGSSQSRDAYTRSNNTSQSTSNRGTYTRNNSVNQNNNNREVNANNNNNNNRASYTRTNTNTGTQNSTNGSYSRNSSVNQNNRSATTTNTNYRPNNTSSTQQNTTTKSSSNSYSRSGESSSSNTSYRNGGNNSNSYSNSSSSYSNSSSNSNSSGSYSSGSSGSYSSGSSGNSGSSSRSSTGRRD